VHSLCFLRLWHKSQLRRVLLSFLQRRYDFSYLQIHMWNLRLAFKSLVLIKKGKSMGLWIHLFLGLIKIQEEIKTKLKRINTWGWGIDIYCIYTTLFQTHTQYIILFFYWRKKILKNPMTDFASWTKSNIFLSECS
jgi:hypothetical protein